MEFALSADGQGNLGSMDGDPPTAMLQLKGD